MKLNTFPELSFGDIKTKIPIIQGGMSVGISLSGLASAVANEGGIGVIGAAGISTLFPKKDKNYKKSNEIILREEIKKAKSKTDGLISVNIMIALTDWDNLLMASVDEGVDFIFIGAGLFLLAPPTIDMDIVLKSKTKIVPIISSGHGAKVMFKFWSKHYNHIPDGVVVEGPLAGGHLGFSNDEIKSPDYSLEKILGDVLAEVKPYEEQFEKHVPVIAAGGIYSGDDIYKFIKLGASGVQMGTRFVTTHECDASKEFKEMYVNCQKDDLTIIKSPVGMPGRVIVNNFIRDVQGGIKKPIKCLWKCLRTCNFKTSPYCILEALRNAKEGRLEHGFSFAGGNAFRSDRIISVKELIQTLALEYGFAGLN